MAGAQLGLLCVEGGELCLLRRQQLRVLRGALRVLPGERLGVTPQRADGVHVLLHLRAQPPHL
jgi:hypothetical protein